MIRSQLLQTAALFFIALAILYFIGDDPEGKRAAPQIVRADETSSWLTGSWEGTNRAAAAIGPAVNVAMEIQAVSPERVDVRVKIPGQPVASYTAQYEGDGQRIRWLDGEREYGLRVERSAGVLSGKLRIDGRSCELTFFRRGERGLEGYTLQRRAILLTRELGALLGGRVLTVGVPYGILMGSLFFFFWMKKKHPWSHKRIQQGKRSPPRVRSEMLLSLTAVMASAVVNLPWAWMIATGRTRVYFALGELGIPYYVLSLAIGILSIDAYLFWTHRLLHVPWIFKRFHYQHHLSRHPSPWASLAVSVGETVLNAFFFPVYLSLVPTHISVVVVIGLLNLVRNGVNHLGFEVFPSWFSHPALSWNLSVTFHELHHKHVSCNYGCVFTFWDRLLGTVHSSTDQVFREVSSRSQTQSPEPRLATQADLPGLRAEEREV